MYATQVNATLPHEYSWEFVGSLDNATPLYDGLLIPENGFVELSERPGHGLVLLEDAFEAARLEA